MNTALHTSEKRHITEFLKRAHATLIESRNSKKISVINRRRQIADYSEKNATPILPKAFRPKYLSVDLHG